MKAILLDLPFSRKCESEADYIGLLLMASACYNPEEAINLWTRMSGMSKGDSFSFFSTHPVHKDRIENIRAWLPDALRIYNRSDCQESLFSRVNNLSMHR